MFDFACCYGRFWAKNGHNIAQIRTFTKTFSAASNRPHWIASLSAVRSLFLYETKAPMPEIKAIIRNIINILYFIAYLLGKLRLNISGLYLNDTCLV